MKNIIISIVSISLIITLILSSNKIFENVAANEIVVIQDVIDGELHVYTTPGLKFQKFGRVTHYPKSFQFWFSEKNDQGSKHDQSISVRFNDAGKALISGSARVELPLDEKNMEQLHMMYGNYKSVKTELVRPAFENAIYMSGPLMSLMQSTSSKRSLIKVYIEDQVQHGIYKTKSEEVKVIDEMTKTEKVITVVKIIKDDTGNPIRKNKSTLDKFNIKIYNLSLNKIKYDKSVEQQIANQQKAIMEVQIAMAEAKKAKQRAITEEQEGIARTAKARWQQEEKKVKKIVKAQESLDIAKLEKEKNVVIAKQRLEVAKLDNQTAEQRKMENIKLGEGEAQRKKLVMEADGALEKKLNTYEKIMIAFAKNLPKQKWVPELQINNGNSKNKTGSNMEQIMQLLGVKIAKDLSLNLNVPEGK